MEHDPGPKDRPVEHSEPDGDWPQKVVRRELITLNAHQVDQMVASLGMCVAAVYELTEAMEVGDDSSVKRDRLKSARKSVEEASAFLEELSADITK